HDLRCRYSRLLREWRRQQGKGQPWLCGICGKSRGQSPDAKRMDLVARNVELLQEKGCCMEVHAVGGLGRTRSVRCAEDGLRQSGPRLGLEGSRVPRSDREILSRLCRAA